MKRSDLIRAGQGRDPDALEFDAVTFAVLALLTVTIAVAAWLAS